MHPLVSRSQSHCVPPANHIDKLGSRADGVQAVQFIPSLGFGHIAYSRHEQYLPTIVVSGEALLITHVFTHKELFKKRAGSELMLDMRSQAISGQYENFTRVFREYTQQNSIENCETDTILSLSHLCASQLSLRGFLIVIFNKKTYFSLRDCILDLKNNFPRLIIVVRDCRLAVTLRYLATGDSYTSLMSKQSIGRIIPDVCAATVQELKGCGKLPKTPLARKEISTTFETDWNVPHCINALSGKNDYLQPYVHSGCDFYNNKSNLSIVLLALVDGNYNFVLADVNAKDGYQMAAFLKTKS
ncbi:hypothetical protein PR048_022695 [Dryococelus australis]|uniref:Uncharacterized protein n=1 Tax=Dryococelus australis TaxID=614101 RepID=A0ABQ9GS19_9NEOP|nr:hypothetical protein PR048_022695 [Dryococelus australis]